MKLTKKHIGGAFDNRGADGSWFYILLDVKKDKLLFMSGQEGRFEIDTNKHGDWQKYVARSWRKPLKRRDINEAWKTARVSPYAV